MFTAVRLRKPCKTLLWPSIRVWTRHDHDLALRNEHRFDRPLKRLRIHRPDSLGVTGRPQVTGPIQLVEEQQAGTRALTLKPDISSANQELARALQLLLPDPMLAQLRDLSSHPLQSLLDLLR